MVVLTTSIISVQITYRPRRLLSNWSEIMLSLYALTNSSSLTPVPSWLYLE